MSRKSCKLTSLSRSCVVVCILLTLLLVELPFNESHAATTQGILGTITRPGFLPSALALDETRNRLFIFDDSTKSIFIYDATTFAEVGSVATTLGKCYSMVIDESLGKLYAGYYGYGNTLQNNIAVIDTAGGTLLKYLLSKGDNNLIKDETQDIVYVSYDGGVSQINATTDSMTAISGIWGNLYTSMAINPQTHELFVANYSQNNGNLFIVNPSSLTVTSIPNLNGMGVAVNWSENKAYISYCQGHSGVCIYDRDTGTSSGIIATGNDSTRPLAYNPLVNRLYSNTEVNRVATIFDGATDQFTTVNLNKSLPTVGVRYSTDNVYFINKSGTYVMSGATGEIVAEFPAVASCSVCVSAVVINQSSGYVYVINESSNGLVTIIQDIDFTPFLPPVAFDKISPTNATTGVSTSPTLTWGISNRATSYEYCYDTSNDNACSGWTSTTDTSVTLSGLNPGTIYYWHVRAINNSGTTYSDGSAGAFWTFATGNAPGTFNKTTPSNGSTGISLNPTLNWGSSNGTTSYEYCYDTTNDSACSSWTSNSTNTSVPLSGLNQNTTYYWHVRAINSFGTTYSNGNSATAFWSFTTGGMPGAFNKTSPANGATSISSSPTLTWGSSAGATGYEYCYDTTNDNACSNWTNNGTATSKGLSGLSLNTPYYWHVRAINSFGTTYSESSTTAFWSFTTGNLPGGFGKTSPSNAATGISTSPTLSWSASNGATGYEYCYDTTNDNACSNWTNNGTATSKALSGLSLNTPYYWHVRAINSFGTTYADGSATAFWSFTTGNLPGAFGKISPANAATGISNSPTLSWGASNGATGYEYCYDTTNDNACSNWTNNGTATSKALSGLSLNTLYYWHVRAINSFGTTYSESSTSAFWSFTTGSLPGGFGKISPVNAATGISTSPTVSWSTSSGATSYEFCYDTSNDNACSSWTNNGINTSIALSGLSLNTTYYWNVRANNSFGMTNSDGSTTAYWSFTTGNVPGAFGKSSPTNAATNVSTSPTLSWGNSSGVTYYEYCYDVTNDNTCSGWTSTTSTSVPLSGLSENTTYYWHVRAVNSFGTTYSNGNSSTALWSFTTSQSMIFLPIVFRLQSLTPPTAPTNLNAVASSASAIHLTWNDNASNEDSYILERSPDGSTWSPLVTLPANSNSHDDSGLQSSTPYYYRVQASNSAGPSDYSNTTSATTQPPATSLCNGDFEQGATCWIAYSTHGRGIILNTGFPTGVTPYSGSWAAWLGGDDDEVSYIQQQVTVPTGSFYLAYYHWIDSEDVCGFDFAKVLVNGTEVNGYDLCNSLNTGGWVKHVVNLSTYAGQSINLQVRVETDSILESSLFVDNIAFQSSPSAQAGSALTH